MKDERKARGLIRENKQLQSRSGEKFFRLGKMPTDLSRGITPCSGKALLAHPSSRPVAGLEEIINPFEIGLANQTCQTCHVHLRCVFNLALMIEINNRNTGNKY